MARLPLNKARLLKGRIAPITIYPLAATGVLRTISNLTGERVKKDPKFRRTMANAAVLGRASGIASFVYRELPKTFRQFWMYKAFTGEAIHLLREGKTDKEARDILWKTYAEVWVIKAQMPQISSDLFFKKKVQLHKRNKIVQPFTTPSSYSLPSQRQPNTLLTRRRKREKELFALPP